MCNFVIGSFVFGEQKFSLYKKLFRIATYMVGDRVPTRENLSSVVCE